MAEATRSRGLESPSPHGYDRLGDPPGFTLVSAGPNVEQRLRGEGERVLVIDDEPSVAVVIAKTLARLGYEATAYDDPTEALRVFETSPDAFDVVLSDFTMPRMTGTELAFHLRAIRPNIPVLICSGHRGLIDSTDLKRLGIRIILDKPFSSNALALAMREAVRGEAIS